MANPANVTSAKTRKVAILASDGFDHDTLTQMKSALKDAGVQAAIVSKNGGKITGSNGEEVEVDKTFVTTASVLFDAVFVPGGQQSVAKLASLGDAVHFVNEAFKHCKPIAAVGEGVDLLSESRITGVNVAGEDNGQVVADKGVVTARKTAEQESLADKVKHTVGLGGGMDMNDFAEKFIHAIAQHRHWSRVEKDMVPA